MSVVVAPESRASVQVTGLAVCRLRSAGSFFRLLLLRHRAFIDRAVPPSGGRDDQVPVTDSIRPPRHGRSP